MTTLNERWGARWVRCAFQVNPYPYVTRHASSKYESEASYNAALVEALVAGGVELIAITDHYRIRGSLALADAARAAGITVLLGFEAATAEGVHMLCVFERDAEADLVQARINQCGVVDEDLESPIGDLTVVQLLEKANAWDAACIAAHVHYDNGLLKHLEGRPRINAWTSDYLEAVAIAKTVESLPAPFKAILTNSDREHARDPMPAIINASDISGPRDVERPGTTCQLKLSELSLRAVRQAFLDPDSRVRILDSPEARPRPVVRAMHWDGGLLDGATIQLADELTVLIGAPGAGKSTVLESLRTALALEAGSDRANRASADIARYVLGNGTTVSVVIEQPAPAAGTYVVQRTLPNPPVVVQADSWEPSGIDVADVAAGVSIFGQHEVADLAEDEDRRTKLLQRFVASRPDRVGKLRRIGEQLLQSRRRAIEAKELADDLSTQLTLLPGRQEQLATYEAAGVADQLLLQTQFDRELRVINTARERLQSIEQSVAHLPYSSADSVVGGNADVESSPFVDELEKLDGALQHVREAMTTARREIESAIAGARTIADDVFATWRTRRAEGDEGLNRIKTELSDQDIDAESFRQLQQSVDELKLLEPRLADALKELETTEASRSAFLAEQEQLRGQELRDLVAAAGRVSQQLVGTVRVSVFQCPDFEAVEAIIRPVGGRLKEVFEIFRRDDQFSPRELAQRIRKGAGALSQRWHFSQAQLDKLLELGYAQTCQLEELPPKSITKVELNVADAGATPRWQELRHLSKGQKATAILLLLLLDSTAPLVVDQPEDDLDNRFIADRVVPAIREKKLSRQFIFATHNANVPVLADAELIMSLTSRDDGVGKVRAWVDPSKRGSIDTSTIRRLVEERLEGGHAAFAERARKYQLP